MEYFQQKPCPTGLHRNNSFFQAAHKILPWVKTPHVDGGSNVLPGYGYFLLGVFFQNGVNFLMEVLLV